MLDTSLEQRIRTQLPNLDEEQARELARIVERLVAAFQPERIYVFGSQARGDAGSDSDVDLLMVVADSPKPRVERAQDAFLTIGLHGIPLDILVLTDAEFEDRRDVPASLAATVLREGKTLYAA